MLDSHNQPITLLQHRDDDGLFYMNQTCRIDWNLVLFIVYTFYLLVLYLFAVNQIPHNG